MKKIYTETLSFLNKMNFSKSWAKISFFIIGIASTIWFLTRVIPKPSRATYPCMKAAAPIMSSFVIYILSLGGITLLFKKSISNFKKANYVSSLFAIFLCFALFIAFNVNDSQKADAKSLGINKIALSDTPNAPFGEAKGIFPGRVVWVMDKDATNENCKNKGNDLWFMDSNTNQTVVSRMLSDGIKVIAGKNSLADSWDGIFKYFNVNHGKNNVGYVSGEKIVIKINLTTMGNGGRHYNSAMDITPQVVMALLQQLVDSLNIAQSDITIGDPYRGMPDEVFTPCHTKYPNIHYIEGLGGSGREQTEISADDEFYTSDNNFQCRLPQAYLDAAYLINMPCLKTHNSAGITIAAKNHQGSVIGPDQDATSQYMGNYLHYDYPVDGGAKNQVMGIYRHITDYMAHPKLGGNTLIYIVDAIWSGRNWDAQVDKFGMPPFNNDWTSSFFISQDAVAIESVGFDFLYNDYKSYPANHQNANFPLVAGVQDYIHQAADPSNWAPGINYDPSSPDHSSPVGSLGVHEHWNNMTDKQYSRDLGLNKGIELIGVPSSLVVDSNPLSVINNSTENGNLNIYPNPVKDVATLNYSLTSNASVRIELISLNGQVVISKNTKQLAGHNTFLLNVSNYQLPEGSYICKVITNNKTSNVLTSKILIKR
jgi:hypothetical protein